MNSRVGFAFPGFLSDMVLLVDLNTPHLPHVSKTLITSLQKYVVELPESSSFFILET